MAALSRAPLGWATGSLGSAFRKKTSCHRSTGKPWAPRRTMRPAFRAWVKVMNRGSEKRCLRIT